MFLKDNPTLMAEVEEKVKGVLGIGAGVTEISPSEADD
jgi:hypothetical protein